MKFRTILLIVCTILLLSAQITFSQQSKLSKGVNYISEFVASDYFKKLQLSNDDLALVDSIFVRAVEFKNGDYSEALLTLTFALVPYRKIPIRIPLLNIIIDYPLTSASKQIFDKKNENLPKTLFIDSPTNNFGDKDKLAHFFGSAYVSYSSNIFDLGNLIGYFIEVFEEKFKIQSSADPRDMMTNKLGNLFGRLLKTNHEILPSEVFLLHTLKYLTFTP
ncbi:MAG TPA: hypothetical protein VKA26_12270 [Ignavibacteriaceae bacterium]|nr:hypothetical protein [Ignavibacteriaceae bacterium]